MAKKKCFKCSIFKHIDDFYSHNGMSDGHLNKCKDCAKNDSKSRELILREDPAWVESEKERARNKYHRLYNNGRVKTSYSEKKRQIQKYYLKYPEKKEAKSISNNIVKSGYQKHHWSYNEEHYKDVIFLKIDVHNIFHRNMIYDQERKMYRTTKSKNGFHQWELLDTKERHIKYHLSKLI